MTALPITCGRALAACISGLLALPTAWAAGSQQRSGGGAAIPTIVCLGDSITRAGYPAILEGLVPVRAINAGVGGDTTRKALRRLDRDVLAHNPLVVVMFFGANDSRKDAPGSQVSIAEYESNLKELVKRCLESGAKVLLGTMPPIDPVPYYTRHPREKYEPMGGLEAIVESYRRSALKIATEMGVRAIDLNALLAARPEWMSADGVHASPQGNRIIAELVAEELKALLGQDKK